jgi:soluble lytic murein transglycosylase-like protein
MQFKASLLFAALFLANLAFVMMVSAITAGGTLASESGLATPVVSAASTLRSGQVATAFPPPPPASQCRLHPEFPQKILRWCDLITRYAEENGLSPNLVAAVILIESAGDPHAYSRSGAVGLMQVMPRDGLAATFQCKNGPCFSNRPSTEELFDPEFNIRYGTRLLASYIKRYGDLRQALKAYGPMDVGYTYADKVLQIYRQYEK